MIGRLARDESGVALGVAVILVALIGVMGAGLLAAVSSDLEAAVKANQGQRAFEMAEAGIEVAKARLAGDPTLSSWSSGELSLEGGSVVVVVERQDAGEQRYVAVSTGSYGDGRREIEAWFSTSDGEPALISWRELRE